MTTNFDQLDENHRHVILYGSGAENVVMEYDDGFGLIAQKKPFEGVIPNLQRRMRETDSSWIREELGKYQADHPCDSCGGKRLKPNLWPLRWQIKILPIYRRCLLVMLWTGLGLYLKTQPAGKCHCLTHIERNSGKTDFPDECRAKLPVFGTIIWHVIRWRITTD